MNEYQWLGYKNSITTKILFILVIGQFAALYWSLDMFDPFIVIPTLIVTGIISIICGLLFTSCPTCRVRIKHKRASISHDQARDIKNLSPTLKLKYKYGSKYDPDWEVSFFHCHRCNKNYLNDLRNKNKPSSRS